MFNTTTIPTMTCTAGACHVGACTAGACTAGACADTSIMTVFSVLSGSVLIAACMAEFLLHWLKNKLKAEEEEEEEEEANPYCEKYAEAYAALPRRELSETELKELKQKFVREQVTEKVEVIMTFDKATETFVYYTDQLKEVSYAILETVAQKFAIDYDCKVILQSEAGQHSEAGDSEAFGEAGQSEAAPQQPSSSVFAKFKNYNAGKGSVPNYGTDTKVIEQMNHFRYRGKIYEYENTQKASENKEEPLLDYTTYKNLLERKEK
jgi:NhaP-type Na+/H+ or K+/H+ antiporter